MTGRVGHLSTSAFNICEFTCRAASQRVQFLRPGYSDNTHFANFLWLQGVPSYYGGSLFTEFAMQGSMDAYTVKYLRVALFEEEAVTLEASETFTDMDLDWGNASLLSQRRMYQPNEGWYWDGSASARGVTWGGCLESVDEILRHAAPMPSLDQFSQVVLLLETSEEMPTHDYVRRVLRALGERGILERIQALLVGRPKGWNLAVPSSDAAKVRYKAQQRETVLQSVRRYNSAISIVQNCDFGHTAPQVCMPYGQELTIDAES